MTMVIIMSMVMPVITTMRCVIGVNISIAPKLRECFGAEQTRNQRTQQWQEEDCLNHVLQPFIKLISSTAIEPRLRK